MYRLLAVKFQIVDSYVALVTNEEYLVNVIGPLLILSITIRLTPVRLS